MTDTTLSRRAGVFALADARDRRLLAAAATHAALLVAVPHALVVGVLFWWCANTVAHNFIHNPFFRERRSNAVFSAVLTVLLGVPQALWRARHLHHHGQDRVPDLRLELRRAPGLWRDTVVVAAWWTLLVGVAPSFVVSVYAPGVALGLGLSFLQGTFEHLRGVTGHDGRLYNLLFANDGLHPEHHARPGVHWADLPSLPRCPARRSRWPAVVRWLDEHPLDLLERLVLAWPLLRRPVLAAHVRAFARLAERLPPVRRAVVVGGGLYPRSALLLRRALPEVAVTIVDREQASLDAAAPHLPSDVECVRATYDPDVHDADLVVLPLAFVGDREAVIGRGPRTAILVHDWLWRPRPGSVVVAWWLLKRMAVLGAVAPR